MTNETGNTTPTARKNEGSAEQPATEQPATEQDRCETANRPDADPGDPEPRSAEPEIGEGSDSEAAATPAPETAAESDAETVDETGDTDTAETGDAQDDQAEIGDASERDTGEHDTGERDTRRDKRRARIRAALGLKVLIPSVIFLLVLAAAVFFGVNYFQYQAQDSARSTSLASGKRILTHFMTFDYKKLNDNVDAVTDDASHGFRSQYKQLVNQLRGTIKKAKASSKPEILASGITRVDGQRADLVFLANTTVKNTQVKSPRADPWRVKLTLAREHGSWKLDGLSFL